MEALNLPKNLELEQIILGSLLIDKNSLQVVITQLNEDVFHDIRHQQVFRIIKQMYNQNIKIDVSTLFQKIIDEKLTQDISAYYLSTLTDSVVSTSHLETHIDMIIELYKRRQIISLSQSMKVAAMGGEPTDDLLPSIGKDVIKLQEFGNIYEKTMDDIIMSLIETRSIAQNGDLLGIDTGFEELNNTLCGWVKPDFVVVAARPGMGKSAMMLSSVHTIALVKRLPTAIFSLEMSSEQLVERLESIDSEIGLKRIRMNFLEDGEKQHLLQTDDRLMTAPLHIEDKGGITVQQLRAKATILKQKYGIKIIFIDYLQLMSGGGKSSQNREQEVSTISRGLKALAKELEVPIIALSQLSRRVEERADKMPQLSDLRESGAIEQDADAVIMLMRPKYYEMLEPVSIGGRDYPTEDLVICKVEKNRHGQTRNLALRFRAEIMKFEDYK